MTVSRDELFRAVRSAQAALNIAEAQIMGLLIRLEGDYGSIGLNYNQLHREISDAVYRLRTALQEMNEKYLAYPQME